MSGTPIADEDFVWLKRAGSCAVFYDFHSYLELSRLTRKLPITPQLGFSFFFVHFSWPRKQNDPGKRPKEASHCKAVGVARLCAWSC